MLWSVERICPFLALESDARTAVAGDDPDHQCRAARPPLALERAQQLSVCLDSAHESCPRYLAAMSVHPGEAVWGHPAHDARLLSTRLVLAPDAASRRRRTAVPGGPPARRWAVGGALALVGVAAVAGGVTGALGSLPGTSPPAGAATDSRVPSLAASVEPVADTASPSPATAHPSPGETPAPPTPQPSPVATPPPAATQAPPAQQTYVVQPGDTLNGIAVQFGTTVAALQRANGLGSADVIVIGQVLVIP
jgi:LysM domain